MTEVIEDRTLAGDFVVKDIGHHARPAVKEVSPPVFDAEVPGCGLGAGLIEEDEISPVVEIPYNSPRGKAHSVGERGAGRILPKAGGVDDE